MALHDQEHDGRCLTVNEAKPREARGDGGRLVVRELVRKAEGLAGAVPLRWSFDPRFGYGARRTRIERRSRHWFAEDGPDALVLGICDAPDGIFANGIVTGEVALEQGRSALWSLAAAHGEPLVIPGRSDAERRLGETGRVLVHPHEEVHVVAKQTVVAGYGVGADFLECVTLMRISGGVINRAGEEVLGQLRGSRRSVVTTAASTAAASPAPALG